MGGEAFCLLVLLFARLLFCSGNFRSFNFSGSALPTLIAFSQFATEGNPGKLKINF